VDAMLAAGWVDEARTLAARVPLNAPAWNALGYEVIRAVGEGNETVKRGRELVITETRQYAKRQRTWFRHQLTGASVTALDSDRPDWRDAADRWWIGEQEA